MAYMELEQNSIRSQFSNTMIITFKLRACLLSVMVMIHVRDEASLHGMLHHLGLRRVLHLESIGAVRYLYSREVQVVLNIQGRHYISVILSGPHLTS